MKLSEMTIEQLNEIVKHGSEASSELGKRHIAEAEATEQRINAIIKGDFNQKYTDDDLIYAATSRCQCGSGFAYPKGSGMHGKWVCSSILKAEEKALPPTNHSGDMPFAFYSVKDEGQPSAMGATTRPQNA